MSTLYSKPTQKIPFLLAILTTLIFGFFLFKNINYIKVPNSDFFGYINEGYQYLNFKLPQNIGIPPLVPLLICLLAKTFTFTKHAELFTGHSLNILCATFTLLNIILILRKDKPWIGFFTIFLLATNKFYITNSLNITNEVTYTYLLTLIILTYSKKQYKLAYFLSGIAFLTRYEAIIIPIIIFSLEFFQKTKRFKIENILIAFLPIILWLIILNFHSEGGTSIIQNHYITEIIIGKKNLPNWQPINSLLDILVSNPINYFLFNTFNLKNYPILPSKITNITFPIIILFLCFTKIISKKNNTITKIIFLTLIGHILFISVFPNFQMRYLFPIIWIVYLAIIDRRNKLLTITLTTILLITNILAIKQYPVYDDPLNKSEYRLIAEWIEQQKNHQPINLTLYQSFITQYYLQQPEKVDFNNENSAEFYKLLDECNNNILCTIKKLTNTKPQKTQFFFITTSNSSQNNISSLGDQYLIITTHMKAFSDQNLTDQDKEKFQLITVLKQNNYHWAKIYQYQKE